MFLVNRLFYLIFAILLLVFRLENAYFLWISWQISQFWPHLCLFLRSFFRKFLCETFLANFSFKFVKFFARTCYCYWPVLLFKPLLSFMQFFYCFIFPFYEGLFAFFRIVFDRILSRIWRFCLAHFILLLNAKLQNIVKCFT